MLGSTVDRVRELVLLEVGFGERRALFYQRLQLYGAVVAACDLTSVEKAICAAQHRLHGNLHLIVLHQALYDFPTCALYECSESFAVSCAEERRGSIQRILRRLRMQLLGMVMESAIVVPIA